MYGVWCGYIVFLLLTGIRCITINSRIKKISKHKRPDSINSNNDTLAADSGNNNTLTDRNSTASPESPAQNVQTERELTEDERMVELEDQLL